MGALLLARSVSAQTPTFNRDVAPILAAHCAACHQADGIAPFSLVTYRDARQRLTQIVEVTRTRVMPPWKAARTENTFVGDRSLNDAQIATIARWAAAGAPEGDPAPLPPVAAPVEWQLGTPDLIVTMEAEYTLQADGRDVFRTFVLPIPLERTRYVRGMEFQPGNPRAVHHANIGVDRTSSSRRLDEADAEPGYVGGMVQDANYPPGYMLGWTPGQRPRPSPSGMAWRLDPKSDFVVQLHMQPTGKPEPVRVRVGLYLTDDPPVRTPIGLRLGSETIEIAAGDASFEIRDSYVVPVDADLYGVQPHAHYLARQMEADAHLPDGSVTPIIRIPDWDFRWQDVYVFERPLRLPKGTRVEMRFVYDNSAANPRNPSQPPRKVIWGQDSSDEMGDLWLQLVPVSTSDTARLAADIERKTRAEDLAGYRKVLAADPQNPLRHDALALLLLQDGRPEDAIPAFRESLRLNPASAPTHYNLGLALAMTRQFDAARAEFRSTLDFDPQHAGAFNNLGAMEQIAGRLDSATTFYRRAVAFQPDNIEARGNLGRVLMTRGLLGEAATEFTEVLRRSPDSLVALAGLGWVRAVSADPAVQRPDEALQLATRAAELSGRRDPSVLDALAAAYAAAGQFESAATTAQDAAALADTLGMRALGQEVRQRAQLYQQRRPYIARQASTR